MAIQNSNRRRHATRLLRTAGIVFAGFLLIAAGWVSVRLLQAIQNNQIRCYILSPPLTLFEKDILAGESFSCQAQNCRVVTRFNTSRGVMCLFPGQGLAAGVPVTPTVRVAPWLWPAAQKLAAPASSHTPLRWHFA